MKVKLLHIKIVKALEQNHGRFLSPQLIRHWIGNKVPKEVVQACEELHAAHFIAEKNGMYSAQKSDLDWLLEHLMERDHPERKKHAAR